MAGSEVEKRAREWGSKLGKELGFDNVRAEDFAIPFWDRGHLHIALTKPYDQALYGITLEELRVKPIVNNINFT